MGGGHPGRGALALSPPRPASAGSGYRGLHPRWECSVDIAALTVRRLCAAPSLPQGPRRQGLRAGRTGLRAACLTVLSLNSCQMGPLPLLCQASFSLSPVIGEMSETPRRKQVELGACQLQLSLPPRSCRDGLSRGEGAPPTVPRPQTGALSRPQQRLGPETSPTPPQCLPQGCTPTVCMVVSLCVLVPPTVPSLSLTSGLDL